MYGQWCFHNTLQLENWDFNIWIESGGNFNYSSGRFSRQTNFPLNKIKCVDRYLQKINEAIYAPFQRNRPPGCFPAFYLKYRKKMKAANSLERLTTVRHNCWTK